MPMLKHTRQEQFARALAQGKTATEAYRLAGYTDCRQNASRLMTKDDIMARVQELQERTAKAVHLSKEWVLENLIALAQQSRTPDTPGFNSATAARALELLGKELGMFVERTENLNANYDIHPEPPATKEDWLEKHGKTITLDS